MDLVHICVVYQLITLGCGYYSVKSGKAPRYWQNFGLLPIGEPEVIFKLSKDNFHESNFWSFFREF